MDLLACLFVCREWHDFAKLLMYKELEFSKISAIDRFIACMQSSPNPPKLPVKKITFTGSNFCRYGFKESVEYNGGNSDKEYGDFDTDSFARSDYYDGNTSNPFSGNRGKRFGGKRFSIGGFDLDVIDGIHNVYDDDYGRDYGDDNAYDKFNDNLTRKVIQLLKLCPYVQTLAASEQSIKAHIVDALLGLEYRLGNLTSFPYTRIFKYNECANLYRDTLKEFGVCLFKGNETHFDLGQVKNFPCLQKLHLTDAPLFSIQEMEIILSTCRQLEDLSIELYAADRNNSFLQRIIALQLHQLQGHSQLQQRYPKMKRLMLRTQAKEFSLKLFNPFFLKLNHLERLELDIDSILVATNPHDQFEELKVFFHFIHAVRSVTLVIGDIVYGSPNMALLYLQAIFQPGVKYASTTLSITCSNRKALRYSTINDNHRTLRYPTTNDNHRKLRYSTTNDNHRKLKIVLPEFTTHTSTTLLTKYVTAFAPYVNTLKIRIGYMNNVSRHFLYEVLMRCTQSQSFTISNGICPQALPLVINTVLHTLVLDKYMVTSEIRQFLSAARINLLMR
jgi:hypothetical protein